MQEAIIANSNHSNNKNDEWYTPQIYIDAAAAVMGGIDLDPASNAVSNARIKAAKFYSLENSGLKPENEWVGKVWMNPPYSRVIKEFINKLVQQKDAGNVTEAIVVTNNGTDTKWFHELTARASAICLHKGRIGFINEDGDKIDNNNKGQVFTYIGNNPERFAEIFHHFGRIAYLR